MIFTAVWTSPEDEHAEANTSSLEAAITLVRSNLDESPTKWGYIWFGGRFVATVWPRDIQWGPVVKELGIET